MSWVAGLFTALANIKTIAEYLSQFAAAVTAWYVARQDAATLSKIADAAAFSANCKTDEERFIAAGKWQDALSRPRNIS